MNQCCPKKHSNSDFFRPRKKTRTSQTYWRIDTLQAVLNTDKSDVPVYILVLHCLLE